MLRSEKMTELTALVSAKIFTDLAKANPEITTPEIVEIGFGIVCESIKIVEEKWEDPHRIRLKQYSLPLGPET